MSALTGAHDKAGILHRDISPGNILIYGDSGLLIDWDLAIPLSGVGNPVHIGFRTGTWQVSLVVIWRSASCNDDCRQFISAALISASKPILHTLEDDLESIVHVPTWLGMRFMSDNVWDCVARLAAMFDEITSHEKSPHTGGTIKSRYRASPGFLAATGKVQLLQIMDNKPYSIMLLHLARLFS
jgi:serine/threonine protein kinase